MKHKKRNNMLFNATNADDLAEKPQVMSGKPFTDFDIYDTTVSEHDHTSDFDDHRINEGSAFTKKK